METYATLSEAIEALKSQGYTEDFNLLEDCLQCKANSSKYFSQHFNVDKFFRFEGMTDPEDSSILYAITTDDGSKGLLVDAYGAYAQSISAELLQKLRVH